MLTPCKDVYSTKNCNILTDRQPHTVGSHADFVRSHWTEKNETAESRPWTIVLRIQTEAGERRCIEASHLHVTEADNST